MNKTKPFLAIAAMALLITTTSVATALAHSGRRMDLVVVDGKIFAQGYNSGDTSDGAEFVRPYMNAIHSHWGGSSATLPGFDVGAEIFHPVTGEQLFYDYQNDAADLVGHALGIELIGAGKWATPTMGEAFTWEDLAAGETIEVDYGNTTLSTDDLGSGTALSFNLVENWRADGRASDLDLEYFFNDTITDAADSLYFLEWQISSANTAIEASDSVYTIHAPPMQFHHFALASENALSVSVVAVPEPAAATMMLLGVSGLLLRRRRN